LFYIRITELNNNRNRRS